MRRWIAVVFCLVLGACAAAPSIPRARLDGIRDPADGLQRYYQERLSPAPGGYLRRDEAYSPYRLPAFYDAQGATLSAAWARGGRHFRWVGWGASALLLGVGIGLSAQADSASLQRDAWWVSLMPAGLVGWTFHWIGDGWFTKPSVALYNGQLARQLGLGIQAPAEEAP